MSRIFVSRESTPGETRVAATPETVARFVKAGFDVAVEPDAGAASSASDENYRKAGAGIIDRAEGLAGADVVLTVQPIAAADARALKQGALLVGFLWPLENLEAVRELAARGVTAFAMDLLPRISRAQKMDALSSQANIAGYKAVIVAAELLPKMFPLMMTPAGTITPAKVMIMGAGVAGLQAIATARRLGAVVEATDVRAAVKEQVESLGAKFVGLPPEPGMEDAGGYAKEQSADFLRRQQELVRKHVVAADVVITTALIPGRPAPRLVGADMVREMAAGSVIVDLAAERGGNCELTRPGEIAIENGVTIVGHRNVPALCPVVSSQMYARNVEKCLLQFWTKDGLAIDMNDEIAKGAIVTHAGSVRHAPSAERVAALGATG